MPADPDLHCFLFKVRVQTSGIDKINPKNHANARIKRGGGGGGGGGTQNHKNIVFLSNTGQDPLKNHKTAKSAFNVGPLTARQQDAI